MEFRIPQEVLQVTVGLRSAGFDAYLVGGCVRDLLLQKKPKDWDVTTNALPEQIQQAFPDSYYTNDFGTVGIKIDTDDKSLQIIEVTPYRTEGQYTDKRRPDSVAFGVSLEEDLSRRDFTINAMALDESKGHIIDPYKGQEDIRLQVLRTVRNPDERFQEDALRLIRGIRLVSELNFALESNTASSMHANASLLDHVSRERIRDEFVRILNSSQPMMALVMAQQLNMLTHIAPDLTRGIGIDQNQAHSYDVFGHLMRTVQHAADKEFDTSVRIAAVFHDVSKPETRRWSKEKNDWTFHGHEVVGAKVTKKALEDLKFSRETINTVVKLVRWHMFFSDPEQITLSAVRRMIRNVGEDNIENLLNLRMCDRIGTGRPKEQPFRFRKYRSMVEEALRDPISVAMLKVNGAQLMLENNVPAGPRIGWTLSALLEIVLDAPENNNEEYLLAYSKELLMLSDEELKDKGEQGKKKREEREDAELKAIMEKNHVC